MHESHRLFVGPLSRPQLIALDLAAAVSFSLVAFTATVNLVAIPPWARLAIPLGLGLPLALRRVWPLPVFLFTVALAVVAVLGGALGIVYVSPAYALYLVAVREDRGSWLPTMTIAVLALLTMVGLFTVGGVPQATGPVWLLGMDEVLFGIAALGGAWTVGRAVRERRMYTARQAERRAEQAVAEERLRIARELHDVVAHNVGLIAVKAGVANHVLATNPEEAHDALRVIENASRNALVEMRHLLGVLRPSETPARGPAPGLRGLSDLAEQAGQAGVNVELDVRVGSERLVSGMRGAGPLPSARGAEVLSVLGNRDTESRLAGDSGTGEPGAVPGEGRWEVGDGRQELDGDWLPEGVELSVYRIVQEALTNVVKHAAPARCRVSVIDDGRTVRIEVGDDGPGHRALSDRGPGHGLIGMRERVMMYGGTFEAGQAAGPGFRVSATLPYRRDS
ncbi:sensor histidine kinase [Nonomuraea sp. MCN248]|uniref:histidine kinase n=1 Tax=Nonomuraea corallina TaxID=2989783 RepID=A0ABT4S9J7_9ACTN|nr:sensor histidine kinase [Nonomuraea corallina]MDA0633842.1 sensor histidine kinase [Nonomuraea corallina]